MLNFVDIFIKTLSQMKPEIYSDLMKLFVSCIASGLLTAYVAKKKGYPYLIWFLIGFFTRIYGLIAIAGIPLNKDCIKPSNNKEWTSTKKIGHFTPIPENK